MARIKKSYLLDAELLEQARQVLGTTTSTETVAEALGRVVEAEEMAQLLAEGRAAFPEWADPHHRE